MQLSESSQWQFVVDEISGMVTILFIVLTLTAVVLITQLIAAKNAPLGYQDEDGFHFGNNESGKRESRALQTRPSPPRAGTASTKESAPAPDAPRSIQSDLDCAAWALVAHNPGKETTRGVPGERTKPARTNAPAKVAK